MLKKCIQHTLSRQFSHIKLVVVGFLCEAVRGGQFSVDFWKYLAVVETEVMSQLFTKGLIDIGFENVKIHVKIQLLNLFALQT